MNKTAILATAAAMALSLGATSQAAPFDGWYVGIEAGYGSGDANQTRYGTIGSPANFIQPDASLEGGVVGLYAGHDWAISPDFVVGIEANYDQANVAGDDGELVDTNEWDQNWEASLRARAGYLVLPNTLAYVTAGWSTTRFDANVLNAPTSERSQSFSGFTIGGGIEVALSPNVSGRVQYRYTDYGSKDVSFAPEELYFIEAAPSVQAVSVGVSFAL